MAIGIFKEWLVKYFFGQNHEILKPAISGFYIRFHPEYRPFLLHTKTYDAILLTATVAR
jgi:hypothetical protein